MNTQSLPSWTYTSGEFFELEKQALFLNSWQLVCHSSNIKNTGDYFTFDFLGESIVVLCGEQGKIRAFHNVCRHRASRLLDGEEGHCPGRIKCPYHNWQYDRDGSLVSVPYKEQFRDFDQKAHGLVPVALEIWQGFIFICIKPDGGPSVAEQFAPVMKDILPYRFEELQPLGRVTLRERAVNWKQIADNYVDALHIPVAHPGLNALVGNSYGVKVEGALHKMWGDLKVMRKDSFSNRLYKELLPRQDHLPADKQNHWLYYRMWPNLAFDIYPDQIDFMQFIPLSPSRTLIREIAFGLKDDRREMKAARYLNWRINRVVNAEDTALIERVQRGMHSSIFTSGPFAMSEVCLIDSAERLRKAIPVSARETEPPAAQIKIMKDELLKGTGGGSGH